MHALTHTCTRKADQLPPISVIPILFSLLQNPIKVGWTSAPVLYKLSDLIQTTESSVIGNQRCISSFEGSLLVFLRLGRIPPPLLLGSLLQQSQAFWETFPFPGPSLTTQTAPKVQAMFGKHVLQQTTLPRLAKVQHTFFFVCQFISYSIQSVWKCTFPQLSRTVCVFGGQLNGYVKKDIGPGRSWVDTSFHLNDVCTQLLPGPI